MRLLKLLFVVFAAIALIHCAALDTRDDEGAIDSVASALCAAEWSPTWRQGSGANEWWVEYEIGGGTVASAYLEIPGVRSVQLSPHYGKWAASAGSRIPTGTQVVIHATTTSGQDAQTKPFEYLTQETPASDPCTTDGTDAGGTDGGTSTDGCFAATFTLQDGANEWWVEFAISGEITSAYLQVVNGQRVTLSYGFGEWRGSPSARIHNGTSVFLHAENASGEVAESEVFPYLQRHQLASKPCSGGGTDGGVDGGGSTCALEPTWTQGSGANEWWIEYAISESVRAASFEAFNVETVALSFAYGKWRGKPTKRIPTGTSVVLRAEGVNGELTETAPFRYLVDTKPVSDECSQREPGYCDGYKLSFEGTVQSGDMLQRGRFAATGTPSTCSSPQAPPSIVDATTEFHRDLYRYKNWNRTTSCIEVFIEQYTGRAAGTGMRSAAYRTPFDPSDIGKNFLAHGGTADVPNHHYSFTVGPFEEFDIVVTGAAYGSSAAQSGAWYKMGVSGCGRMTVVSISPTSGPATGGTSVTIKGVGFTAGENPFVTIGSEATAVTIIDDTTMTAVTSATPPGTYDVTVEVHENMTHTSTLPRAFTYVESN